MVGKTLFTEIMYSLITSEA